MWCLLGQCSLRWTNPTQTSQGPVCPSISARLCCHHKRFTPTNQVTCDVCPWHLGVPSPFQWQTIFYQTLLLATRCVVITSCVQCLHHLTTSNKMPRTNGVVSARLHEVPGPTARFVGVGVQYTCCQCPCETACKPSQYKRKNPRSYSNDLLGSWYRAVEFMFEGRCLCHGSIHSGWNKRPGRSTNTLRRFLDRPRGLGFLWCLCLGGRMVDTYWVSECFT